MIYKVHFCTEKNGWNNSPIEIGKDWKLKQWKDNENRLALIQEAQAIANISDDDVRGWRIYV